MKPSPLLATLHARQVSSTTANTPLRLSFIAYRRIIIPTLFFALLLGACAGGSPASTQEAAVPSPTAEAYAATQPSGNPSGAVTEPAAAGTKSAVGSEGCTVVSPQPTPGPTEQSLFPPVSDQDWVQGPAAAPITIIEYSDFQ